MTAADYVLIRDAYTCMLKVPPTSPIRVTRRYQRTLAGLCEVIARESGLDRETVQNEFEGAGE